MAAPSERVRMILVNVLSDHRPRGAGGAPARPREAARGSGDARPLVRPWSRQGVPTVRFAQSRPRAPGEDACPSSTVPERGALRSPLRCHVSQGQPRVPGGTSSSQLSGPPASRETRRPAQGTTESVRGSGQVPASVGPWHEPTTRRVRSSKMSTRDSIIVVPSSLHRRRRWSPVSGA